MGRGRVDGGGGGGRVERYCSGKGGGLMGGGGDGVRVEGNREGLEWRRVKSD